MAARPKTPDATGLSADESLALIEGTRLGRVLGPIIKAIGKVSAGEEVSPEDLALETLARRLDLLSQEAQRDVSVPNDGRNLEVEIREVADRLGDAEEEEPADILRDADPQEDADPLADTPEPREDPLGNLAQVDRNVEEQIAAAVRKQMAAQYIPDTSSQRVLVEPPTLFSKESVLKGRDAIDELRLNFSCLSAKGKFSGTKDFQKRGELDVISFLESLSRGQMVMMLQESEFLRTMILATTGAPQEMLMELIKENERGEMPIADIYLRFTDSYFFELRPEQAMAKLQLLSPTRHPFICLSEAENQIKQWAKLASLEFRTASKRATMTEWHFKDFYLKIIPDKFSSAMTQSIERLEGLRNREVTSTELIAMTRSFRIEIDQIFYRKNHSSQQSGKSGQGHSGGANSAKVRKKVKSAQSSGKVNVLTRQQAKNNSGPQKTSGNSPKKGNTGTPGVSAPNGSAPKPQSSGNGRGNTGGNNNAGTGKFNPYKHPSPQTALKSNGCRLCGQSTHIFADCLIFKPHERVVGQNQCPCPMRAYHLNKYCPLAAKN